MEAMVAPQTAIKVAALCGSLPKGSFNRGLIRSAIELTKESVKGMEIQFVDLSPLPTLNTDLEVDGTYRPVVEAFRQQILQADCYLFASPHYNYSVTGLLMKKIDWASRPPNVWADKAAAILSAGGSFGGGTSTISPSPKWSLSRPSFHQETRMHSNILQSLIAMTT